MNDTTKRPQAVKVSRDQLPASCPPRGDALWNRHPKVYLPLHEQPEAVCPYCSTRYVLED